MNKYVNVNDDELKSLLESQSLEPYEKMEIVNELIDRGSIILDRVETIH